MASNLEFEEMQRMRQALGMAPLPAPGSAAPSTNLDFKQAAPEEDLGSTLETREAAGFENWKKVQDEAEKKKRADERKAAIKRERDAAQRFAKLEGRGLGDVDDKEEIDTKAWLIGQAKRQKKIAKARQRQIEQELLERENQAQYTEKDLTGLKVGHELGDFEAGTEQIITLKDRAVDAEDDDDEDVLENADLRAKEQLQERLFLKKKTAVYDPHAEDETGERKLLAQYDEEIDGKKQQKKFTLDGTGRTIEELAAEAESQNAKSQGTKFSLDFLMDDKAKVSDYMDISEIKVKKPKKRKDKAKKQKNEEDMFDLGEVTLAPAQDAMQLDATFTAPAAPSNKRRFDEIIIDDEDLQSTLAAQRRAALKKRRTRPEDIARQLREEASTTPMDTDNPEEEGGLVIDETSEFVANLQKPEAPITRTIVKTENPASPPPQASIEEPDSDADGDVPMENQAFANEEEAEAAIRDQMKRETGTPAPGAITTTGLEEEKTITQGLGAALAMLKQRNLIKTADSGDLNAKHRERQRFMAERQNHEASQAAKARAQRERDRASGKFDRMSAKEREQYAQWENKQRDQADSRHVAEVFNKEYKPDVNLKYIDDHGRNMNQKEAFKFLSHAFHGKGSGNQKTEKRLKKIDDEKKRESSSLLDVSQNSGMTGALGVQSKKNRQAGVRLQ